MGILDGLGLGQGDQNGWLGAILNAMGQGGAASAGQGAGAIGQAVGGAQPTFDQRFAQAPSALSTAGGSAMLPQPSMPSQMSMAGGMTLPQQPAPSFPSMAGANGFGAGADMAPPNSMLPPNAAPAIGQGAPAQAPQMAPQQAPAGGLSPISPGLSPPGPGIMDRLQAGATNFTTGGNPLAGLLNSISGLATGQRTDAQGIAQSQLLSTYHALVSAGVQPGLAQAAAMNPAVLKDLLPQLYNKPEIKEVTDAFGQKRPVVVDAVKGTQTELTPTGGGAQSGTPGAPGFLAPGVRQVDSSLQGDPYLAQFSPELQADVKNRLAGKIMTTGNPRPGYASTVKLVAEKYAADTGQSADDATFAARKKMREGLSSTSASSMGGQINMGNTAIGHLADLASKAEALGNYDVLGPDISHMVNDVRGHLSSAQAAKMQALQGAAQHYGQEITKFYAGSPGGEAERNRFMTAVGAAKTPQELASVIETEAELAHSRVQALGDQIQGTLGDEGTRDFPVLRPSSLKALDQISGSVQRLRGGQAAPAQQGQQQAPRTMTAQDQQAITWASQNPTDPRAAQIKQRLGVQ